MSKLISALNHIEQWANELSKYSVTCAESSRKHEIDLIIADMREFVIVIEQPVKRKVGANSVLGKMIKNSEYTFTGNYKKDMKTANRLLGR